MVATRGRTFKRPWRRSCLSSKLKSSSAPIGRKDSWCFHAVGSSNAPLLGSTAAEGLPRIGRTSIATRWRSCGLPQSASCSENFVIPPDVFGQTLNTRWACSDTPGACEAPCVPRRGTLASRRSTVAIFGSGPALPSPDLRPDRSQRAPRIRVIVPGGRGPGPPETSGYQPRAAGRHSSLHLQEGALEDTPRKRGCEFI